MWGGLIAALPVLVAAALFLSWLAERYRPVWHSLLAEMFPAPHEHSDYSEPVAEPERPDALRRDGVL